MYLKWATLADLDPPPSWAEDPDVKLSRLRSDGDSESDEEADLDENSNDDQVECVVMEDGEAARGPEEATKRRKEKKTKNLKWRNSVDPKHYQEMLMKNALFLSLWRAHEMYPLVETVELHGEEVEQEIVRVSKDSKGKLKVYAWKDFPMGKLLLVPLIRRTANIVTDPGKGCSEMLPQVSSALAGKHDLTTFYIKPALNIAQKNDKFFVPPAWAVQFTDDRSSGNCKWVEKEMHNLNCFTGTRHAEKATTTLIPVLTNIVDISEGDELLILKPPKKKTKKEEEAGGDEQQSWVKKASRKAKAHETAVKKAKAHKKR